MLVVDFHSGIRLGEVRSEVGKTGVEYWWKIDLGVQKVDKSWSTNFAHLRLVRF